MLKLPLCPYCASRFLYPQIRKVQKKRTILCPHCNNKIRLNKKYQILFCLLIGFLLIVLNWFLLSIPSMNLWFLLAVTASGVAITYFLLPFALRMKKAEKAGKKAEKSG